MKIETVLLFYGVACIIFPAIFVCRGFITNRRHICTTINGLFLGYVPFLGFSSIAFALKPGGVQIPYANYPDEYVYKMIASVVLFTFTLLVTYNHVKAPPRVTKFLEKRPKYSPWQPVVVTLIGLAVALLCTLPRFGLNIPVISNILARCMTSSVVFAATFAFAFWWKNRGSLLGLTLVGIVFSFSTVLAVSIGGGRRAFLGVLLAVMVNIYWAGWHKISRTKMLLHVGVAMLVAFLIINSYAQVRHYRVRGTSSSGNIFQQGFKKLQLLTGNLTTIQLLDAEFISDIGQNATNASLYSIHLSHRNFGKNRKTGLRYPSYLHSALFVVVNPMPRAIWEDKPLSLGYLLARERLPGARVTWGPGLAGHFYHEGGAWMAVFYGIMIGTVLKWVDTSIQNNQNSLFLSALFAALLPQLILAPRGDLGNAMLNWIFCVVTFVMIRYVAVKVSGAAVPRRLQEYESC